MWRSKCTTGAEVSLSMCGERKLTYAMRCSVPVAASDVEAPEALRVDGVVHRAFVLAAAAAVAHVRRCPVDRSQKVPDQERWVDVCDVGDMRY